jgi:hypothetical protein
MALDFAVFSMFGTALRSWQMALSSDHSSDGASSCFRAAKGDDVFWCCVL